MILDSARALVRARAQIGQPDGLGRCLENVYNWFGAVQSIGAGSGHYSVALAGWQYAVEHSKFYPMEIAPAGVPVWFDVSPDRTDRNKYAGDVGLSIGGGYGIFTDSFTGNTGVMSFVDRARQIHRPPLGFTTTFLGHDTSAGLAFLSNTSGRPIVVTTPPTAKENPMSDVKIVRDAASNTLFVHNSTTGIRKTIENGDAQDLSVLVNGTGRILEVRIAQLDEKYLRPIGVLGAIGLALEKGRPLEGLAALIAKG